MILAESRWQCEQYANGFAPQIEAFFDLRVALGHSPKPHAGSPKLFDRYCAAAYPLKSQLSEEIVLGRLENRCTDVYEKATTTRLFVQY